MSVIVTYVYPDEKPRIWEEDRWATPKHVGLIASFMTFVSYSHMVSYLLF